MNIPTSADRRRATLAILGAFSALTSLHAAALQWDPIPSATIEGASGVWDTSATNLVWNDAGTNVAWTQTSPTVALHTAQFAGLDGTPDLYTVQLAASVAVSSPLRFASSGYNLTADLGTAHVITTPQITTNSLKTATISGPITVRGVTTFSFAGYGTLTLRDGATVSSNGGSQLTFSNGSKVRLLSGSTASTPTGSVVIGSLNNDATSTEITVDGGTLSTSNPSGTNAIVLSNSGTGTLNTTVTLTSGAITNTSPGGGIRFGTSGTSAVSTVSATLNLDGGTLTAARIYEGSGAANNTTSVFNFNGGTLRAVTGTTNGATFFSTLNAANVKAGGAIIDTNGAAITIGQALLADAGSPGGGLEKKGAGTLTLTGANTYTGPTLVSSGTLAFTAPHSALTSINVSPAAKLQINTGSSASSLPALTLQSGALVGLNLGIYTAGNVSSASFATFEAAGNYQIDLSGTNIPTGSYTVFSYGSKTGSGQPTVGILPPGVTVNLVDNGSAVILTVLTPQLTNYFWSAGSGNWDTATANWTGQIYSEPGLATFPDISGANTVTLTGSRAPFSVDILNGTANSYTFTGSAIGGSGPVNKTGAGVVTFASPNAYSGATTISAGALVVSADAALGSTVGSTTIANGAVLALSGGVTYSTAEPIIGSGPGTLAALGVVSAVQRGMIQSLSGHSTFAGPVTINASGVTRFGVQNGASLTLSGTIAPAVGVTGVGILFRAGDTGDFITLSGSGNQWDLTTAIFTGANVGTAGVRLGVDNGLSTSASVVASGNFSGSANALDLNGYDQTLPGLVPSEGTLLITNQNGGTTSILTLNTASADFTSVPGLEATNLTQILNGAGGTGLVALVKKGAFRQTLQGSHFYSGSTTIEAGTLAFGTTGTLGATPVTLLAGSTLDVAGINASDFALTAGLSGSGTVEATAKTVTVSTNFAPGALAVTGNLTLAPGTASTFVAAATPEASSSVSVNGALVLAGSLAIIEAPGFDFATGQSFTFASATGGLTAGLTSVSVNGSALTESTPDVWTATIADLDYTFVESTGTLEVAGGVVISPLQAWRDLYFGTGTSTSTTGPGADASDFDKDGVANLIEYIANTDPTVVSTDPIIRGTTTIGADTFLTLTYPRRAGDATVTYTVQGSTNLLSGFAAATGSTVTMANVSTYTDDVPVNAANPRRFLRLEVTSPAP